MAPPEEPISEPRPPQQAPAPRSGGYTAVQDFSPSQQSAPYLYFSLPASMTVEGVDVRDLVKLYFSTVHREYTSPWVPNGPDFGYLSFIHEADYWERFEQGRVPEGLTLLMAASALR